MDEQAEELVNKCQPNVFDIEDIGKGSSVFVSVLSCTTLYCFASISAMCCTLLMINNM